MFFLPLVTEGTCVVLSFRDLQVQISRDDSDSSALSALLLQARAARALVRFWACLQQQKPDCCDRVQELALQASVSPLSFTVLVLLARLKAACLRFSAQGLKR